MNMDEFKNRKTPRLKTFDYNTVGVYFITICTENRKCILSHVVGTGVPDCPCASSLSIVHKLFTFVPYTRHMHLLYYYKYILFVLI